MRGRPLLFPSYEADSAIFPSTTKKVAMVVFFIARHHPCRCNWFLASSGLGRTSGW